MTSFFLICMVWVSICMGLLSAENKFRLRGHVDSSIVLPCELRVMGEAPYIRWSSDTDVFERSGKEKFQGQGYEGRTDVPEDQLLKGDCSLELKNLSLMDAGVYRSYQVVTRVKRSAIVRQKWELISSVELLVDGTVKEANNEISIMRGGFTDAAGMTWPHPLLMFLSLLSCFTFQLIYRETGSAGAQSGLHDSSALHSVESRKQH